MEKRENQTRLLWLDIAKGIVMLLVVFGHTVRGGAAQQAVYGFHVPAFFLLSGMSAGFSRHKKGRLKNDFLRIMVPYYIWGLISIGIYLVLGHVARDKLGVDADATLGNNVYGLIFASSRTHYMRYNLPLWFLPCLFASKAVFYGLQRLLNRRTEYILAASALLCVLGFVYSAAGLPCLPFALEIAVKMLPFFALGNFVMEQEKLLKTINASKTRALLAGLVLLAAAVALALINGKVNYSSDAFSNPLLYHVGALAGCAGVVLLSAGIGRCRILSYVGQNTMGVLVMHKFPVMFFQIFGPVAGMLKNTESILSAAAGAAVSVAAVGMCLVASWIVMKIFPFALGAAMKKTAAQQELPKKN